MTSMSEKKKVLVCEDNPNIQLLLKIFFQKRGYEPIMAPDGVEAIELAKAHQPSLIVMDVIMPGKDGIEAVRELRASGVTTPIVMLTSKDYEEDRKRALAAGATVYLLKPFNPSELQKVVEPFLR